MIFLFASSTFTMETMAKNPEEEFELVLGNRHLLSLFFVVVIFFAGFFTVGYTVGYGQGEESRPAPTLARVDPTTEPLNEIRMPDTLLKDAPKSPKPTVVKPKPPAEKAAVKPEPKPVAANAPAKPSPAKAPVAIATPEPKPSAQPKPEAAKAGDYHLQVAAVRVKKDAEMLAGKLKAQGYPASVQANSDGWNRVIVGPFASAEAAQSYKTRLSKDGFDTQPERAPAAPNAQAKPKPPVQAANAGDYHLQVVAVRVKKDAEMLAGKLKTQGYPASVQMAGDWNRVIVGPFASAEAAQDYKTRLGKDGFDTMLRKL